MEKTPTPALHHKALRYGFAPLLLLGANGLALALLGGGTAPLWCLTLLLAAVAVSFAAERVLPYQEEWNRSHDDAGRDLAHAVVNEGAGFATLLFVPVFATLAPARDLWPADWPFFLQVLFSVLVLDLGITLAHFASHRLEWLWRFHAVHHSVRRLYGFNGLMKHPVHQAIETFAGTLPLLLLGLPGDVAAALVFAVAIQLLLQHSNVDYTVGPLRWGLATAEVHRFHHRKEPELGDVNFGLFTTLGDHLLGTYHWEPTGPIRSDELGIGDRPDYPTRYWDQLLTPFASATTSSEAPTLADGGTPNI